MDEEAGETVCELGCTDLLDEQVPHVCQTSPDANLDDYSQFFSQSLDLLAIAGLKDGYFKLLNPAWTNRLGWRINELKGQPFIDFVHPDDRDDTLAEVAVLNEGANTICFENRYRHRDGSYRRLQWNARPDRRQICIYAIARDITNRRRLEREILEVLDGERARLGQELHDGTCQSMAGIAALSAQLSRDLQKQGSPLNESATEISQLLHESIETTRDIARGLGPLGLISESPYDSLPALAHNVSHQFAVACTFGNEGRPLDVPEIIRPQLYRIAQEAVHNGIVHGQADEIQIGLKSSENELTLSVLDNGIGIKQTNGVSGGVGLHTMAYRANLIGASLEISRCQSHGTQVSCSLNLSRPTAMNNHSLDF